jgi:hypothetical protein
VKGLKAETVVEMMHKKGIIMSNTPYRQSYARFAPSLLNNEQEIELALAEISALGCFRRSITIFFGINLRLI